MAADEGLFTIPRGWMWVTLEDLCEIKGGITKGGAKPNVGRQPVPYLRVANVQRGYLDLTDVHVIEATNEEIAELQLHPGDILFTEGGDRDKLGRGWIWEGEIPVCIHQNHVFRARPYLREITSRWLSWYGNTLGQRYFMRVGTHTTNLASINITKLRAFPIPLPPVTEQQRIVAKLEELFTRLDAGVAALKAVQAQLKCYRASVLKAAVEGRLVPTEAALAHAEGREYEPADVLLARILHERRAVAGAKYKEPATPNTRERPELPEGWVWATFAQLSERVTVGFVGPMKHEYIRDGIPFLRSQNVRANRFDPEGLLHISPEFHRKLAKSTLRPGDLAVVRSGSVGVTCVIPETLPVANCSDLVLVQRPNGILSHYGAYYMNSLAKRQVEAGKVGVALAHFNTKSVAALSIPLPPLAEQHRIVAEVERRLSVVEELEATVAATLARAARLRQSLLKRAFEGKLVPQDPSDEPASVLLERIRGERDTTNPRQRRGKPSGRRVAT